MKRRIIHIIGWVLFAWGVAYFVFGGFLYGLTAYLTSGIFAAFVAVIGWLMAHDWKFRKRGGGK